MKGKLRKRVFVVLIVTIITLIIAYIAFRGTYLETKEIGEKYINAFWQNLRYMRINSSN